MTILVAGATGNVGRHVVAHLVDAGQKVRALSRNPLTATLPGAEVVRGDLADPASLASALDGVTALHLINFSGDYEPLETGADIVALARKAGVKRVTVLRGGDKGTVEHALEASDLEWTFIQPVEFMSGVFDWAGSIRDKNLVKAPFAQVRSAMVHDGDIGAVIATVLMSGGHGGRTYTLTGPEALTVPDKVAAISHGLGREVSFVELTEAEARQEWKAQGLPDEVIEFFVVAHGNPPEQAYIVLPTVQELLGRPARGLVEFVEAHKDRFN